MTRCALFLPLVIVGLAATADARPVRAWTYQELLSGADVVVIATPLPAKATEDTSGFKRDYLAAIETTLTANAVLKGNVMVNEQLKFVHYRLKDDAKVINGARLIHFRTKGSLLGFVSEDGKQARGARPKYLLFLKRRSDGRYEAVSGQMDPIDSVKLMSHPDEYPPADEQTGQQ